MDEVPDLADFLATGSSVGLDPVGGVQSVPAEGHRFRLAASVGKGKHQVGHALHLLGHQGSHLLLFASKRIESFSRNSLIFFSDSHARFGNTPGSRPREDALPAPHFGLRQDGHLGYGDPFGAYPLSR